MPKFMLRINQIIIQKYTEPLLFFLRSLATCFNFQDRLCRLDHVYLILCNSYCSSLLALFAIPQEFMTRRKYSLLLLLYQTLTKFIYYIYIYIFFFCDTNRKTQPIGVFLLGRRNRGLFIKSVLK